MNKAIAGTKRDNICKAPEKRLMASKGCFCYMYFCINTVKNIAKNSLESEKRKIRKRVPLLTAHSKSH